jgi:sugar lactone lactonase YvrE
MIKHIIVFAALVAVNTALVAQENNKQLEVVAELAVRPANVAVTKEGRVFATIHPLGSNDLQVVEIIGKNTFKPYPNKNFQKNGKAATNKTFDAPLGITVEENGNLLVLDMGSNYGKTRIFCFDTKKNILINTIELSEEVAPKGSFIQDLAVDETDGWIYLADITDPALIALNVKTKKARRFKNHPSLQAENRDMIVDGKLTYFSGQPARVAVDPLTISADKQTLFFGAMNGTSWYKVSTKLFKTDASDEEISKSIQWAGSKPISDGALTDKEGNHYFTNVTEHAVSKLDLNGNLYNILQDKRILWPDDLSIYNDWMYICTNQLNTTPAFTGGKDLGKAPYFIYRFKYQENKKQIVKDKYSINNQSMYPEGIDFDFNNNRFVVGSLYNAEVYTMSLDGALSLFIKESKITAITGVFTDELRNRLIVVGGDIGLSKKSAPKGASAGQSAYAEIYNLSTGELIKVIDLKPLTPNAGGLANDIATDQDGNIYITDSFSPVIYKIDIAYKASIFVNSELFKPAPGSFGLNGIVYHPDGYLLVAKTDNAKLFKVSISNPERVTEVSGISFKSPDGLEWTKEYKLIIAGDAIAGNGKTYTFSSTNSWETAKQESEMNIGKDEFPTTAALGPNGEVYVVSAKLGKLLTGDTKQSNFTIQKIK